MRQARLRVVSGCSLVLTAGLCAGLASGAADPVAALEHGGALYPVLKDARSGMETTWVFMDGAWVEKEQWRGMMAARGASVMSAALERRLAEAAPGEMIDVIVVLRDQPAAPVKRAVRGAGAGVRAALVEDIRSISKRALPAAPMTPAEERAFVAPALDAASLAERRALSARLDDLDTAERVEVAARVEAAARASQDALIAEAAALGGVVTARVSAVNMVGVRLPAGSVAALAGSALAARMDLDAPGEPELDNHQHSLGLVTGFWANGITGGVHDVGVLDTGVQQNHPALSPHSFISNMGVSDTSNHGTGMAGIMASTSTQFPGVAFGCDQIVVALAGSATTSMNGMQFIAGTGVPEAVNYSFGNGTASTVDYAAIDQFFDGVIHTFGYMVSKSTGNGGFGSGAPTITHPAPAFNLLASANMDDFNTVTRVDDRITSSSSRGPTAAGRKKPDITAPGNNSMSTAPSGGFANIGGTSSASPHTGAGFVLLWEMGAADTKAGKAILLNTTDPMNDANTSSTVDDVPVQGSFWNRRYGWGYLNLGQAHLHGLNSFLGSVPPAPETADFRLYAGPMFQHERATLVWERHVAYNGNLNPTQVDSLSDLDLFAFRASDNALLAASQSAIDNVEQLSVSGNEALVVLKVEAFGSFDPDVPVEEFALATQEAFTARTGPAFGAQFQQPPGVSPGSTFTLTVQALNTGDLPAHGVMVTLSGLAIVSGANPQPVGVIGPGGGAAAQWTVTAPATAGQHPVMATLSSASYGETFSGSASGFIGVSSCPMDVDGDGAVGFSDLNLLLGSFGLNGDGLPGDVNGDGVVNFFDLNLLLGAYGVGCP
ncbi:MAG: S8 family serine peptidase [Phycisphaerales bacterium]|nr:S8 family serine peptidase [Phycisphaerales bacterium]